MSSTSDPASVVSGTDAPGCYGALVSVVHYNTGYVQPPLIPEPVARGHVFRISRGRSAEWDRSKVAGTISTAVERGDLFRWVDDHGDAGRSPGTAYIGIDDGDVLRGKLATYITSCKDTNRTPNRSIIGVTNQRIAHTAEINE